MSNLGRTALILGTLAVSSNLGACSKKKVPKGDLTPQVAALIEFLPADAKILMGADLSKARGTKAYDLLIKKVMPETPPELLAFKEACGLDLLNDINLVVASAGDDVEDQEQMYFAFQGKFTQDGIAKCIQDVTAEKGTGITISEEGKLTVYQSPEGKAFVYWAKPDVVVASWAGVNSSEGMKKAVTGGAQNNAELMSFVKKVDTGALVWIAGPTPSSMRSQMAAMPAELEGFFAAVTAPKPDSLKVLFGMRLGSADDAETAADQIDDQKDQFKSLIPDKRLGDIISRLEIMQSGKDLAFAIKLSMDDIDHVMGLQSMMGGGFGL